MNYSRRTSNDRSACATRPNERGTALVVSLFVLFVMMGGAAASVSISLAQRAAAKTAKEVDGAFNVAETGVNVALYELQIYTDLGTDGMGFATGSLGSGSYAVALDPPYSGAGTYTIRSVGTVGRIRRGVETVVKEQPISVGFFGLNNVELGNKLCDSYDSALGTYASQVGVSGYAGSDCEIGTNGDVLLTKTLPVHGDLTPGPGHSVIGDTTYVSGSTTPGTSTATVPPYVYSPTIPSDGPLNVTTLLTSGTYRYDSLAMTGTSILTLDGNVELYVDGNIDVRSEVRIAPGSNVTIHQGPGDFSLAGKGIVNTTLEPRRCTLFSASTGSLTVGGTSALYARIEAPQASVIVNNGDVYGSILAGSLTASGGGLHHDLALARTVGGGGFSVLMMRPFRP